MGTTQQQIIIFNGRTKSLITSLFAFLMIFMLSSFNPVFGQDNGFYETYVILDDGNGNEYYDAGATTGNPNFQGADLGTFTCNDSLKLGGQGKTWKCPPCDITATRLIWRVWSGVPSGAFSAIDFGWISDDPGAICVGGQNQTWEESNPVSMAEVVNGLAPGTYTLELYFEGNATGGAGCTDPFYDSNGGVNYTATFVVEAPSISIGPFVDNPFNAVCVGDEARFLASPTAAGPPAVQTYTWTFSGTPTVVQYGQLAADGATRRNQGATYDLSDAGLQTVDLTVTFANGCVATAPTHNITVSANAAPVADKLTAEYCVPESSTDAMQIRVEEPSPEEEVIWILTVAPAGSVVFDGSGTQEFGPGTVNNEFRVTGGFNGSRLTMRENANNGTIYGTWTFHARLVNTTTGCESYILTGFSTTANALPVMICPDDTEVCENEPDVDLFTLTPTASPAGGTFSGTGVNGSDFSPSVAGVGAHIITYEYTDNITNCTDTCTFDITVLEAPSISIDPFGSNPFNAVCVGDEARFLASPTAAGPPAVQTYAWTFSGTPMVAQYGQLAADGATRRNQGATYDLSDAGLQTVDLTVTFANGCVAVAQQHTIDVYIPALADAGPDQEICSSETAAMDGSIGGSATMASWSTSGDGTFDNSNLLTAIYTPGSGDIAAGTVELTLTADDPASPCPAVSDSMILTIILTPVLDPHPDTVICDPTYTLPDITGSNLSGNEAYYTGPAGTGIRYLPGDLISATATLYLYDESFGITIVCSDEHEFEVTIVQLETRISGSEKPDYACSGTTLIYSAVRPASSAGSTIAWGLNGGGTIISTTDDGVTATVTINWTGPVDSGPYCLTLTETKMGCTGSDRLYVYLEKNNLVMACNNLVFVALDHNCRDTITADQILEAPLYPDDSYTVTVFNTNGFPRSEPIVDHNDIGETLMVLVRHNCSGLACMGNIIPENNHQAMLICQSDTIKLQCDSDIDPESVGFPVVLGSIIEKIDDNIYEVTIPGDCGGVFDLFYTDVITQNDCDHQYQTIIKRQWILIDDKGNVFLCVEVIAQEWADFDDMELPCNFDGIQGRPYFQCNDPNPLPGNTGIYWPFRDSIPGPEITGYPGFIDCRSIQYYYEDIIVPKCGYNRTVIRSWIILDWCTGRTRLCDQILVFIDDNPPIFDLPPGIIEFDSNILDCFGDAYPLPLPNVRFECSDWTYEVIGYHIGNVCDPLIACDKDIFFKNGYYGIRNIPVDSIICVIYEVTDECGLSSFGNMTIRIRDRQMPTAICDKYTVVTLGQDGLGRLDALSLDDLSWDNCGIDKYEIRRTTNRCGYPSDLVFGEYVNLCCADVGQEVKVILRVTDLSGNSNECFGYVTVDDKERPVLTYCPPNFTISCEEGYINYFPGGKPTATDNCEPVTITHVDLPFLNNCGVGTVRRTWTIKDKAGNETLNKCVQIITVVDDNPLTYDDIIWPADIVVDGCYPGSDVDVSNTGFPVVNNEACKDIGIAYQDLVFPNPIFGNYCVEIHRTFKIGDWCNPSMPLIEHTQIISVNDGGVPVFIYCPPDTTVLAGDACSANVTISAFATDDCTPQKDLIYTYKVDKGNNGTFELSGNGNTVSTTLQAGLNRFVFTVTDGCGNSSVCTRFVRVKDTKPPTPVCIHKITTSLGNDGEASVLARHFNRASFDDCTPSNYGICGCETDLRFSFSTNINDTIRTFDCSSLDNGIGQVFTLEVWVWDLDDNKDYCVVEFTVLDTKDVCPDVPEPLIAVTGLITDELGTGLEGFEVRGINISTSEKESTLTDDEGHFFLTTLNPYSRYQIDANKKDNPMDGLSTLDLVLIQKHILNLKRFDSPYQYIAADVNNSNTITAADILELRKLILGVNDQLGTGESWKFLKAYTEFDNPEQPWGYEYRYFTDSLYIGVDSLDFIAVKIGDINRSASAYNPGAELDSRNMRERSLVATNFEFVANEALNIDLKRGDIGQLSGFQFTLEFDSDKLRFIGIEDKEIQLSQFNINVGSADNGIITFSWNSGNPLILDADDILFTLNFKTVFAGQLDESIKISSKITKSEIYDHNLEIFKLTLRFDDGSSDKMKVHQNSPNPFSDFTEISFDLPADDNVTIRVYSSTGKLISEKQGHYSKGPNQLTISKTELAEPGVYLYELTNRQTTIVNKMVLIR